MNSPQFFTIQQIDAIKGIRTPHYQDLKDIGKKHVDNLKELSRKELVDLSQQINASLEDLDYGESWTITKEFFPEVKIHVLLQVDNEEFGGDPYELQFLFSGDRVTWISGEDLCHLCEILLNYASTLISNEFPQDVYNGEPSQLVSNAMRERTISWKGITIDNELRIYFTFSPFPDLLFSYDVFTNPTDFSIVTKRLDAYWIYDVDRLIIMGLNQILRLVKIRLDETGKSAPPICNAMFSGYYKKTHTDKFE